jgi:hypothetical protein
MLMYPHAASLGVFQYQGLGFEDIQIHFSITRLRTSPEEQWKHKLEEALEGFLSYLESSKISWRTSYLEVDNSSPSQIINFNTNMSLIEESSFLF